MKNEVQVVAWEGGELRMPASRLSGREVVLALPLTRLLLKMVRVPPGEDPVSVATPILKAASPFPDEELTVSCETVCEAEEGSVVIAAALPEGAADDIADALDAHKLVVTRVDALVLGQIRSSWARVDVSDGRRRLLRLKSPDCTTVMVLDGDRPSSIRAVVDEADMKRAETLSLLEAEDFGGPMPLAETVDIEPADPDEAVRGVAERTDDPSALNALPASWREVMTETRFKSKLVKSLAVAGTVWALAMGVLLGVPIAYDYMTDRQKGLSKQHFRRYKEVVAMKERVDTVRKHSDHTLGALEIMKAVSDRLPEGVTLLSWNYQKGKSLQITGEAPSSGSADSVLTRTLESLCYEDENGQSNRVFAAVRLGKTSIDSKKPVRRFPLELDLKTEEEE